MRTSIRRLARDVSVYFRGLAPLWYLVALHWHMAQHWVAWRFDPLHPELAWRSERINHYELRLGVRGVRS